MVALKIGGGAYSNDTAAIHRECINLFPEVVEDMGRSQIILRQAPGLGSAFSTVKRPVRGMHVMNDVMYVVGGDTLYSISHLGVATAQSGTITQTSANVSMANNNASAGAQLLIMDGGVCHFHDQYFLVTGSDINMGYVFTAGGSVTAITDTDFPPHGTNPHAFSSSNLEDGTAWTATDTAEAEGNPDKIISMIVSNRDLIVLGARTTEFYRDVPSGADFPFTRSDGSMQERGCLARFSVAGSGALNVPGSDNTIYFLGDDRMVYRIENYLPIRISNHALERRIELMAESEVTTARGYTFNLLGHYFYALAFSDETWVYDATTSGLLEKPFWHQRSSGIIPIIHQGLVQYPPWRITHLVHCYGRYYGGDAEGNIFKIDPKVYNDNGQAQRWVRTVGPYFDGDKDIACSKVTLVMNTGRTTSATTDAQVSLRVSRDGGRTWGNRLDRDIGVAGEYRKQIVWRRLGRSPTHGFVFEFSGADNVESSLVEAYADFERG